MEVDWWISPGLGYITNCSIPYRKASEIPRKIGFFGFFQLLFSVRSKSYQAAVVFHAPWWVSCLLWMAQIPIRVGVRSQWHSFIFLNRSIRQKRSLAEMSELEYGFRLVEEGLKLTQPLPREELKLRSPSIPSPTPLNQVGLKTNRYVVVHPGMAGSALNWPSENYEALILRLSEQTTVVITGTKADEAHLAPLKNRISEDANVVWLDSKLTSSELLYVLENAQAVVAPSTGVVHLAASLGRPTVGIYSPVRVQHPRRWAPQGPFVKALVPDVNCPATRSCLGTSCKLYNCMKTISVEQVYGAVTELSDSRSDLSADPKS
jgi:ADP-heptose:LPS heptosyltransferase